MAGDSEQNNDASLEEPEELESPSKEETSEEEIKQQKEEQIRRQVTHLKYDFVIHVQIK